MEYFPAHLTARYTDGIEAAEISFVPDRTADYLYSISLHGKTIEFDSLDELIPELPLTCRLIFTVPARFSLADGALIDSELDIEVRPEPDGKEGILYRCGASIDGRSYSTEELSDRSSWAPESGLEGALTQMGKIVKPCGHFRICFYCRHSDYEPNTGTGHLYCFIRDREAYERFASADSSMERKYRIWNLDSFPVDEFHSSDGFEPRPENWGYRG
jgi:hypothetical protein